MVKIHASTGGGVVRIDIWLGKILNALWCDQRKKEKNKTNQNPRNKNLMLHTHYFPYREVQVSQTLRDEKKNDAAKWLT